MILTRDQLQALTGYKQRTRVLGWLRRNGIRHYVRADGWPAVPVDNVIQLPVRTQREPDYAALEKS